MPRVQLFVDGSNLSGSLRYMSLEVDNYSGFFGYVFERAAEEWRRSTNGVSSSGLQLVRTNWYVLGSLDDWDLGSPKTIDTIRDLFMRNEDIKSLWLAKAGQKLSSIKPASTQADIEQKAFELFFEDSKAWYAKRKSFIEGIRRFSFAVESYSQFVRIKPCGHWKVDLLRKAVAEKRLDTTMAVEMLAQADGYDIVVLVSGDADSIPSLNHLRERGKQALAVEFVKGYPPEAKGRAFSSKLRAAVDLVIPIYESDLVQRKVAKRIAPVTSTQDSLDVMSIGS